MKKWILGVIILTFIATMSIVQYNHDKNRALKAYNKSTLFNARIFRLNEGSDVEDYYINAHQYNLDAATEFANKNRFHFFNLFKKDVPVSVTTESLDMGFDLALQEWYNIDPPRRIYLYNLYEKDYDGLSIASSPEVSIARMKLMELIKSRPQLYGESYSKNEYQNQSDYENRSGDALQDYIDDQAYNENGNDKDIEAERESNIKDDTSNKKSTASRSSYSETKKSRKMEKIDNNFNSVLSAISNKFSDEEGVSYHAGGQSTPKLPSEYKKNPKTFTVSFTPIQSSVDNKQTSPIYTVKLVLDKKDNTFIIINTNDLPSYLSELGK